MEYLCDHQHQLYPISMPDKAELRLSDGFNLFNFAKIDRGMVECGVWCGVCRRGGKGKYWWGAACFQITIFGMFIFTFIKLTICLLSDCEG